MCALADKSEASDLASGTSSDEDEAASGNPTFAQPKHGASPEQIIIREVQDIIDNSHVVEAEKILCGGGRSAASLQAHVERLFLGNTEEGSRMKLGDWTLYCKLMYKGSIPEIRDVQWPPSAECWTRFLLEARVRVSSYKRFQGVVGNVCEVANRFWSKELGVLKEGVDPRLVYSAEHSRTMHTIKREHGMGVKQVLAVTMDEARNATHFGDAESVRGVAMCAAFTIGTLMGGRRPRTLTGIRLRDLKLFVGRVVVDGVVVRVPCVSITFREEKYDDIQGPREATDVPHCEGYAELRYSSCAYWIYRLLVFRGAFFVFDPIKHANVGDTLKVKPECLDYFLFCDVRANFWIDTAPSSVSAIGIWNKTLLIRMGSPGRGFSAHRSGFVSRTCILAILASKGKELSPGTIEVMIRWGGWQAVTGARTLLRIYARKVIDKYLDPYGLSLGYELSDKAWELKKKEYLGRPRYPEQPFVDRGRKSLPLQIRVHAWRSKRWMDFQKSMNDTCAEIMSAALADKDIMPVHRYRQARRAFSVFVSERAECEVVQEYRRLLAMRQHVWLSSVRDAVECCESAFFRDAIVARPDNYLKGKRFLEVLQDVHIGHMRMDGRVDQDDWEGDAGWDVKGIHVWKGRHGDAGM